MMRHIAGDRGGNAACLIASGFAAGRNYQPSVQVTDR
ncbi:hypothetical protein K227x_28900 [Rubripirellula lacrimiformis]|uniref:Uncharacterized protein n=1 Tax=Rubripirellula lacrimiformis TaxID=1930273 RepID=A0A517NBW4_9BACT|nr:hypothetical protein K227x_28900 [Rubripirellula lacrimiformis]